MMGSPCPTAKGHGVHIAYQEGPAMPKISRGGVTDVNVDENYIAPAGTPPQDAIDLGLPDAGQQEQESADERRDGEPASDRGDGQRGEGDVRGEA
jgi:hypothetical protein